MGPNPGELVTSGEKRRAGRAHAQRGDRGKARGWTLSTSQPEQPQEKPTRTPPQSQTSSLHSCETLRLGCLCCPVCSMWYGGPRILGRGKGVSALHCRQSWGQPVRGLSAFVNHVLSVCQCQAGVAPIPRGQDSSAVPHELHKETENPACRAAQMPPVRGGGWACAAPGQGWPPLSFRVPCTGPHLSGFLKPSMRPPPGAVQQRRSPGMPPERRAPCSVHPDADPALLSKPQGVASPKADCE